VKAKIETEEEEDQLAQEILDQEADLILDQGLDLDH
jgi:S-adenosylhomocysteine hydrolase